MTMPYDSTASSGVDADGDIENESAGGTGHTGVTARTQIREVKDQVVDQAKTSFRQARDSASSSLNDSRHVAADKLGGIAGAVRGTSDRLRSENQPGMANLAESLAEQVDTVSRYLRDRNLGEVRDDLERFARRQPAVALGVALAIGVLGARFLKSARPSGGGNA